MGGAARGGNKSFWGSTKKRVLEGGTGRKKTSVNWGKRGSFWTKKKLKMKNSHSDQKGQRAKNIRQHEDGGNLFLGLDCIGVVTNENGGDNKGQEQASPKLTKNTTYTHKSITKLLASGGFISFSTRKIGEKKMGNPGVVGNGTKNGGKMSINTTAVPTGK